ncbi:MAG: FG-GAP-like repeat-containing protein [Bacteroidales bacterium]
MRILFVTIVLLIGFLFSSLAQQPPFSLKNVSLPQLAYSACAWGDFDHDGDLDLALTGAAGNDPVTRIFRNDDGNFTDLQSNLLPLHFGSVEWGDYDSDGDLDLLATGIESQGTAHTLIFKNTDGTFAEAGISLPGVVDGQATWGDLDNDGNLDILLTGSSMARIYRNTGDGNFITINAPLPDLEGAMCCWNDYNNDGQPDVMVCGNTGGGIISKLFKNDHGTFTEVTILPDPFLGLYGGQARWTDLDKDGDQDLVIAGMDLYVDGYFLVYRNDGNDHFTRFDESDATLLNPFFDLADYDADGLTDVMLIGTTAGCGGPAVSMLMKNQGSMDFSIVSSLVPGYKLGGVTWGDYNNDGYSDLLFTGLDVFEFPKTELYLNNLGDTDLFITNTRPSAPLEPTVATSADQAILRWRSATDIQTPENALTYNIRIGTLPDSFDALSPLAVLYTGMRSVAAIGNAGSDTSWTITGIPAGTYYFSVQAVDNGFSGGFFSDPVMFNYLPVGLDQEKIPDLVISPNPCYKTLNISRKYSSETNYQVRVYNEQGRAVYQGNSPEAIAVANWPAGIYLLQYTGTSGVHSVKLIKSQNPF